MHVIHQWSLLVALLLYTVLGAGAQQQIDAKVYAKIFEVNKPAWARLAALIKENTPKGASVIDIGAGPGEPTTTMAKLLETHTFALTDSQVRMIENAKRRAAGLNNVEFHVASAEDLSAFPTASFDAATACYVLMFVNLDKSLKEMARVLKPGGVAFVTVWTGMPFYEMTVEALKELYSTQGFKGSVPALGVNPLSLSTTQFGVSSVETGISDMADINFKIKATEEITYDFHFGDQQTTCDATLVLGAPFAAIATEYGKSESELKAAFCAILESKITAHAEWKRPDGTFSIGKGVANLYTLEKAKDNSHEL